MVPFTLRSRVPRHLSINFRASTWNQSECLNFLNLEDLVKQMDYIVIHPVNVTWYHIVLPLVHVKTLSHSACDIFIRAFQSDAILFLCLSNAEGLCYFGFAILPVICAAFPGLDCNLFDFSRQNMTSVAALAGIPASTGTKVVYLAHWTACVVFKVSRTDCQNGNAILWLLLNALCSIAFISLSL